MQLSLSPMRASLLLDARQVATGPPGLLREVVLLDGTDTPMAGRSPFCHGGVYIRVVLGGCYLRGQDEAVR